MKLQGRIPVEPLEDERLTNIERNLVVAVSEMRAPAQRAPRRLLAFAGAMAAVAVAGFVGYKLRGGDRAHVEPQAQSFAMKDSTVDLGDAQITSTTGTEIAVVRAMTTTTVQMKLGKVDLHVEHRPGRLFVVKAGDTQIEDIGTRFSVDYDGTNVEVRVTEGEVKVRRAGKDFQITQSEAWTTEGGETTIAKLDEKLAAAATATQVASITPNPAGNPTTQQVPNPANVGSAASPSGSNATTGNATSNAGGNTGGSNASGSNAGSGATRIKGGKPNAKNALENAPLAPLDVGTTDPAAAKAKYLELVRNMQEGEDRARILYSIAVMEHRQKKDDQALHSLTGVTARPASEAYKDALWLEVRIRCLRAFNTNATPVQRKLCVGAVKAYETKFKDGSQTGITDAIVKEISAAD